MRLVNRTSGAAAFLMVAALVSLACSVGAVASPAQTSSAQASQIPAEDTLTPAAPTGDQTTTPGASGDGLSEADAIAMARVYVPDKDAQVRTALSGTYEQVFAALVYTPPGDELSVDDQRLVWGVEFVEQINFCPYLSTDCYLRPALRSVWIDYVTGDFVRATTYSPNPGDPLPTD